MAAALVLQRWEDVVLPPDRTGQEHEGKVIPWTARRPGPAESACPAFLRP